MLESASAAYAGGVLLACATIPQAWRLLRTRDVSGFAWSFTALNFVGLALLTWRSWTIREWAFFGVNVITTTFWGAALAVKITSASGATIRPPPGRERARGGARSSGKA